MPDKMQNEVCLEECVHEEIVREVSSQMPPSDLMQDLANLFKVLGDFTRVRILQALHASELCVCDLVDILQMSQSAVSHQLRVLRTSKIVKYRKEGKNVFYSLDDQHVYSLLSIGLDHIQE